MQRLQPVISGARGVARSLLQPGKYWRQLRISADSWRAMRRIRVRVERDKPRLMEFRNRHQGSTIFCLGNGPSLLEEDLQLLNGRHVILTNRAFQLMDRFKPEPAYACMQDYRRIREVGPEVPPHLTTFFSCPDPETAIWRDVSRAVPPEAICLMPSITRHLWRDHLPHYYCNPTRGFSGRLDRLYYSGGTVIFMAIQLAAWMGAARIVLLGTEMKYDGPTTHFAPGVTCTPGSKLPTEAGFRRAMAGLTICRNALAQQGTELLDASTGGRINVLPRLTLAEAVVRGGKLPPGPPSRSGRTHETREAPGTEK